MAQINFGGVNETVVTREEFPLEKARKVLEKYIPLLYDERKARKRAAGAVSVVDDYSVLSVDVKHFTPVADAVADGLQIADGSQLRLLFNPKTTNCIRTG